MIILAAVCLLAVTLLAGMAVQRLLKFTYSVSNAMMLGFTVLIASFHVVAYPLTRLNATFTLMFWIYSAMLVIFAAAGAWAIAGRGSREITKQYAQDLWSGLRRNWLPVTVVCLLGLYVLTISCGFAFEDSDESYYLPRAMEMIANNRLNIPQGFGWSGIETTSYPNDVDASTLEAWRAYWSCLFGLHVTVFSRNSFTVAAHLISWCAAYQAFRSLAKNGGTRVGGCVFLAIYLLFMLLDGDHLLTTSCMILRGTSHGKALIDAVTYPSLFYACGQIAHCGKGHIPWQKWFVLSLILTAGIGLSIVGVYWPFLCCLTMGLPYLLIERRKDLHKLIGPLLLTCLPVIVYSGISLVEVVITQPRYFEYARPEWFESMRGFINIFRVDLFVIAFVLLFVVGGRTAKIVLGGSVITLALTLLNPLFVGFVSKYLSTGIAYPRMFWMLPVYFLPAYVIGAVFEKLEWKGKQASIWTLVAMLLVTGYGVPEFLWGVKRGQFTRPEDEMVQNQYGLISLWPNMGDRMLEGAEEGERVTVMWCSDRHCNLRQYSERFIVLGACRKWQWKYYDMLLEDGTETPLALRQDFEENGMDFSDPVRTHAQLAASGVDYVCMDETAGFVSRDDIAFGFEPIMHDDGIVVYRVIEQ